MTKQPLTPRQQRLAAMKADAAQQRRARQRRDDAIRREYAAGHVTMDELGHQYGLSHGRIEQIVNTAPAKQGDSHRAE